MPLEKCSRSYPMTSRMEFAEIPDTRLTESRLARFPGVTRVPPGRVINHKFVPRLRGASLNKKRSEQKATRRHCSTADCDFQASAADLRATRRDATRLKRGICIPPLVEGRGSSSDLRREYMPPTRALSSRSRHRQILLCFPLSVETSLSDTVDRVAWGRSGVLGHREWFIFGMGFIGAVACLVDGTPRELSRSPLFLLPLRVFGSPGKF